MPWDAGRGEGRRAQFAMVTAGGEWEMKLMSIPYDVKSFLQDFRGSGLDQTALILNRAVKKTLVTGVNYFYLSILEVQRETGLELSQIPESAWEKVAERLEL